MNKPNQDEMLKRLLGVWKSYARRCNVIAERLEERLAELGPVVEGQSQPETVRALSMAERALDELMQYPECWDEDTLNENPRFRREVREVLMEVWRGYRIAPAPSTCPHGAEPSECNACFVQSDYEYDAARERAW